MTKIVLGASDKKNLQYEMSSETEDSDNEIPYHARAHAQPFSYGNLPNGFKRSDLKSVKMPEPSDYNLVCTASAHSSPSPTNCVDLTEYPKPIKKIDLLPAKHCMTRRFGRPSVSPSRSVLRKPPTRKEFEEMLRERQAESKSRENYFLKAAQNATIKKDLDDLQEKLNKRSLKIKPIEASAAGKENLCREIVKHVESIDLPDELDHSDNQLCLIEPVPVDEFKRSETPAFPVPKHTLNEDECIMIAPTTTDHCNLLSNKNIENPCEVAAHLVKFARDSSEFWYKPFMAREEATALLRQAPPGTFLIRKSTTYKNAYGLVLKVAKPPQGVRQTENSDALVRHFLLEPTTCGVRLKGNTNEPTFTSLSALVYEHCINQLSLPTKLILPTRDLMLSPAEDELMQSQKQLLDQGAACNVLYLFSMNVESLTGDEAIRKAVHEMYAQPNLPSPVIVHFKVSQNGITLTDNKRQLFFRRHYISRNISYIATDPDNRFFTVLEYEKCLERDINKSIFAFVARPLTGSRDNQCHLFCDLDVQQPAWAIVSFAHKVLPHQNQQQLWENS